MKKFFAVNIWKYTGEKNVISTPCETMEEAKKLGTFNAERYKDSTFSHVVSAENYNAAKSVA